MIDPEIQEAILDILPDDGSRAMELICQLVANMILSIPEANLNDVIISIKTNLATYEGT